MTDAERIEVLSLVQKYAEQMSNASRAWAAGDYDPIYRFKETEGPATLREINYRLGGEKPE